MKIVQTFLLLFLNCTISQAQEEAMHWYFGDSAALYFNSGTAVAALNSAMKAEAGCAAISDINGELQFYTNGREVYNKNNLRMPNGFELNGSQLLNQNCIIVPLSDSIYYLFTINAYYDTVGLNYSVVDMKQNNGDGDVVLKNQLIRSGFVEKIAATKHCNGEDTWVITHDRGNKFYSYLLNQQGIFLDTIISESGTSIKADIGYMKVSPASNMLAFPVNNDSLLIEVFRFDNRTGAVFDPKSILAKDETVYAYGLEFSPDGNRLYMNTGGKKYSLWQYDVTTESEQELNASGIWLADGNLFAMQLAPDGKIYIAKRDREYLSAINQPNERGLNCSFQENAIGLQGKKSLMGLPNFIASYYYQASFAYANTCLGDTTHFFYNQYWNADSVVWSFGDGSQFVSIKDNPVHQYQSAGTYEAQLLVYRCNRIDSASQTIQIHPYPKVNLGNDTVICNTCSLLLDGGDGMDFWRWQDGTETQNYEANTPGEYNVLVSKYGCESGDSISISNNSTQLMMPTAFTPNNDGINDELKPVFKEYPSSYQMNIFARNGQLIFQTSNIDEGWNGKYKGQNSMMGVYVYKIVYSIFENNTWKQQESSGTVTLLR